MQLGYIIHGPVRVLLDSVRVYCFIVGLVLAGALFVYTRRLWGYTRAVDWTLAGGSVKGYARGWVQHNKRLLGRIFLGFALISFDMSAVGTEILLRWGHDMGYWRLPVNALGVTLGLVAVVLLLLWNTLGQEASPAVVTPPSPAAPSRRQTDREHKNLTPWVLATVVVLAWFGLKAYQDQRKPPGLDQSTRCVVAALAMHQQDATAAHQANANSNHYEYTSPGNPFPLETADGVRLLCARYVP